MATGHVMGIWWEVTCTRLLDERHRRREEQRPVDLVHLHPRARLAAPRRPVVVAHRNVRGGLPREARARERDAEADRVPVGKGGAG